MIYEDMKDMRKPTSRILEGAIPDKWGGKEREI